MKNIVEFPESLQKIADDKAISGLYESADFACSSSATKDQGFTLLHNGIAYGRAIGKHGLRVFCVVANEAHGPTQFFYSGDSVASIAARLKKLEDY